MRFQELEATHVFCTLSCGCICSHPLLETGGLHAELLRENKRMLDKAIRELDRERMALQNQEKKVIAEIKKTAKQEQMVRLQRSISNHHIASFSLTVCLHAGCCQSYGQILGQEQTCSHKDVWSQVTIASSLTAHTGKVSRLCCWALVGTHNPFAFDCCWHVSCRLSSPLKQWLMPCEVQLRYGCTVKLEDFHFFLRTKFCLICCMYANLSASCVSDANIFFKPAD